MGEARVKKYVVIKERLARAIFKELGDIAGLNKFPALSALEEIIAETLELGKEELEEYGVWKAEDFEIEDLFIDDVWEGWEDYIDLESTEVSDDDRRLLVEWGIWTDKEKQDLFDWGSQCDILHVLLLERYRDED